MVASREKNFIKCFYFIAWYYETNKQWKDRIVMLFLAQLFFYCGKNHALMEYRICLKGNLHRYYTWYTTQIWFLYVFESITAWLSSCNQQTIKTSDECNHIFKLRISINTYFALLLILKSTKLRLYD